MSSSGRDRRRGAAILPGDFRGFEPFREGDPQLDGLVLGEIRRSGASVELGRLSLERPCAGKRTFANLQSRAERLSRELTYLDEHLEIVDHDRRGMTIQLRSLPPYKDDEQIQFNEISIGRDRLELQRIAFYRRDEVRRQVPLNLRAEDLERLFCDLRQVLGPA